MPTLATRIGIAVVEHDNGFLVGVRGEDSPLAGKAEFPGGKCEAEETPAECAVRECREETGLEIRPIRLLDQRTHEYDHGHVELNFWLCEPQSQNDVTSDHQGFRWIPREDLKTLDFPDANRQIVRQLTGGWGKSKRGSEPLA